MAPRAIISAVYERHNEPLLSRRAFAIRLARHSLLGLALLAVSLAIGIVGYIFLGRLQPIDAFMNAAMILGGMGPVDPLPDAIAKLFAGVYALYSGIVFLVVVGVVFAPVLHRLLHHLHLDTEHGKGK